MGIAKGNACSALAENPRNDDSFFFKSCNDAICIADEWSVANVAQPGLKSWSPNYYYHSFERLQSRNFTSNRRHL